MNASERREVGRALALVQAGDRTGAVKILRALRSMPARSMFDGSAQLVMRFAVFHCEKLGTEEIACVCVSRQMATDIQRTTQTSRGQGTSYPLCDTRSCEQGRRIRSQLDPHSGARWRGAGPGGRFERSSRDTAEQESARRRQARAGLLGEVRTLDVDPDPVDE